MCMSKPSMPTQTTNTALLEQLNTNNNVMLSNQKVASTTGEKKTTKRNVGSLRVPLKSTDTSTTGLNTTDSTTGLNIPV